jgi:hypothetical protein
VKLSCPTCGAEMSLDVLLAHEGARDAVLAALRLPAPIGKQLIQYVSMFRPPKRQLSWARLSLLLADLLPPISAAQVERNGRTWPAPLEYWKAALEQMVQLRDEGKLQLPLKSHGYLFTVIVGMSEKAEAKGEAKTEARRAGVSSGASPTFQAPPAPPQGPRTAVPEDLAKIFVKRERT